MGNTCQKMTETPEIQRKGSRDISSYGGETARRRKLRDHDIISIECEQFGTSGPLSPLNSDDSNVSFEDSMFANDQNDVSTRSFLGLGIRQNPLYGSPAHSTGSVTTTSSSFAGSFSERTIEGADIIDEALRDPMLPPLENSYEEEEDAFVFESRSPAQMDRPKRSSDEMRTPNISQSGNASANHSEQRATDLMNAREDQNNFEKDDNDDARLEKTPQELKKKKGIRAKFGKKAPKGNRVSSSGDRNGKGKSRSSSDSVNSAFKKMRFSPWPQKLRKSVATESSSKANTENHITMEESVNGSQNNHTAPVSPQSVQSHHTRNDVEASMCFSEASSLDIFDQIRTAEVPDSVSRLAVENESFQGEPQELELLFQEIEGNDDSRDLLSRHDNEGVSSSNNVDTMKEENISNQGQQLFVQEDANNTYEDNADTSYQLNQINETSFNQPTQNVSSLDDSMMSKQSNGGARRYDFSHLEEIALKNEANFNGQEDHLNDSVDVVAQIRKRLLSAKKILTPRNTSNVRTPMSTKSARSMVTSPSIPVKTTIDGSMFTPIVSDKRTGKIRMMKTPKASSILRGLSPKQNLKAAKKAMSPQKHSFRGALSRKASSRKMLLVAENSAISVKARIAELNAKLKRARELRQQINVDSEKDLPPTGLIPSSRDSLLTMAKPKKHLVVNAVMRDKGASIVKKNTGKWTNYSMDGAGTLWKKRDDLNQVEQPKPSIQDLEPDQRTVSTLSQPGIHKVENAKNDLKIENKSTKKNIAPENKKLRAPLYGDSNQASEIVEYFGEHPCLSDVSPLTMASSVFRFTQEKTIEKSVSRPLPGDLVPKIPEEELSYAQESIQTSITKQQNESVQVTDQPSPQYSSATDGNEEINNNLMGKVTTNLSRISENSGSKSSNQSSGHSLTYTASSGISVQSTKENVTDYSMKSSQNEKSNLQESVDNENSSPSMVLASDANAKVNVYQQKNHQGPPDGLCLSPVQRTPLQARKWRDLAAAAAAKDNTQTKPIGGKKQKKKKKKRTIMSNIMNETNI